MRREGGNGGKDKRKQKAGVAASGATHPFACSWPVGRGQQGPSRESLPRRLLCLIRSPASETRAAWLPRTRECQCVWLTACRTKGASRSLDAGHSGVMPLWSLPIWISKPQDKHSDS